MTFIKSILVCALLISLPAPCVHAEHHSHDEVFSGQMALSSPCTLHECDHEPCAGSSEIRVLRRAEAAVEAPVFNSILIYVQPIPRFVEARKIPPPPGILASLQTVQLLY